MVVNVTDGTAKSPGHFIADVVTLDFGENEFSKSFSVRVTAGSRPQAHPYSGVKDDVYAILSFATISPRHGTASAGPDAHVYIKYRCGGISLGCGLQWDASGEKYVRDESIVAPFLADF